MRMPPCVFFAILLHFKQFFEIPFTPPLGVIEQCRLPIYLPHRIFVGQWEPKISLCASSISASRCWQ